MKEHDAIPNNAISAVKAYLLSLQSNICKNLEQLDGKAQFIEERWTREQGGGGITRVLEKGQIFAKAGVNFSHVMGEQLPPSATSNRPELSGSHFEALGVSLVIHPDNPYVPTTHANVRFFLAKKPDDTFRWWFGGGFDLTPYYGFEEDCRHWHQMAYDACKPFGPDIYPRFKNWCDNYFFLKHRQEARGIGGLFFDDYDELGFSDSFALMQSIGDHFLKAYEPIVRRRKNIPFGEKEKNFQLVRRGRYVEFNLVYDRGTLFGLQSQGRTESILMSLPPEVHWMYDFKPEKGSLEEKLYTEFLPRRNWLG